MQGITISEIVITLIILMIVSALLLGRVFQTQEDQRRTAQAKRLMSALAEAVHQLRVAGLIGSLSHGHSIASSLHFESHISNGSTLDLHPSGIHRGSSTLVCNSNPTSTGGNPYQCYRLHTGGTVAFYNRFIQCSTQTHPNCFFPVFFDPDGVETGRDDSLLIGVYLNGRVTTSAHFLSGSRYYSANYGQEAIPSWFSW